MDKKSLFDSVHNKDRVFGKLCQEADNSYENENYLASLACLFILAEQVIKYSLDKNKGNYSQCLIEANKKKIISDDEFRVLNNLRDFRNVIFHENNYSSGIEIDKILFPSDEDETKKIIFEKYSSIIFNLVEKILSKNV